MPDPESAQGCLRRRPVVGRRDGDPPIGVAQAPEQRREIRCRDGGRDRVGLEPGALDRPPSCGDARAPAADDGGDELRDLGHRCNRERGTGPDATVHRVEADRREDVAGNGSPSCTVESPSQFQRPAAPHRVEVDECAVLVEDDELDAVEQRREP